MSDLIEAAVAVLVLAFGGVIFLTIADVLESTALGAQQVVDFGLLGVVFFIAAVVLGGGIVAAGIASVLRGV